jgi:hypothetical protein
MATGLRRIDNNSRAVRTLEYLHPYMLYEHDASGNLIYMGQHYTHGAAGTDTSWLIYKYSYGAEGITSIEKLEGAWDSRSSLDWV